MTSPTFSKFTRTTRKFLKTRNSLMDLHPPANLCRLPHHQLLQDLHLHRAKRMRGRRGNWRSFTGAFFLQLKPKGTPFGRHLLLLSGIRFAEQRWKKNKLFKSLQKFFGRIFTEEKTEVKMRLHSHHSTVVQDDVPGRLFIYRILTTFLKMRFLFRYCIW